MTSPNYIGTSPLRKEQSLLFSWMWQEDREDEVCMGSEEKRDDGPISEGTGAGVRDVHFSHTPAELLGGKMYQNTFTCQNLSFFVCKIG